MLADLDCIPCFFAQAVRAGREVGLAEAAIRELLGELGRRLGELDPNLPPPVGAPLLYGRLAELAGTDDPFAAAKRRHTDLALALLPVLRRQRDAAADPLDSALRIAAAGNILDLGALSEVGDVEQTVRLALDREHARWDLGALRSRLADARRVLVLGDNAGETVFDRVLLETLRERYGSLELVYAARGGPIINDATVEDARRAGLDEIATLVSTGSALPGIVLDDVSPELRVLLAGADVVLAKGQGNYETMSELEREAFFLLTVKCRVVARQLGLPRGASALVHQVGPGG